MSIDGLREIVLDVLVDYLQSTDDSVDTKSISADTKLIGRQSVLDSAGMVSVLIEVEQRVLEQTGCHVSLMSENAMSQSQSPFLSVDTLAQYLNKCLNTTGGAGNN